MNLDNHHTVQFTKLLLKFSKTISEISDNDLIIFKHLLSKKIQSFQVIKLLDDIIIKYKDVLKNKYNIEYITLQEINKEITKDKKTFDNAIISINNNILEIKLPWLTKELSDQISNFLLENNFLYDEKVWYCVNYNETIFDKIENNEIFNKIGFNKFNDLYKKEIIEKIKQNKDEQKKLFELSAKSNTNITFNGNLNNLYPYQKVVVEYSLHRKSILIADQMGLGKSASALAIAEYHNLYPVVCIVPANIKYNWIKEINKWIPHRKATIIDSDVIEDSEIYIISYNMIVNLGIRLRMRKPKLLICDESHYLKTPNSQRTIFTLKYFNSVPYKILTTGTPILNRTIELIPQLRLLDTLKYFGGEDKFKNQYTIKDGFNYKSKNEELLQAELRKICMIRRMKKDVAKDLPEKIKQYIPIPMNRMEYDQVELNTMEWYEKKLQNDGLSEHEISNKIISLNELTKIEYLRQVAAKSKLHSVYEWIDNALEQTNKILIFAHHREILENIHNHYKQNSILFYGGMSNKIKQSVDDFVNNDNINLFIGSIQASGIGIDGLQNICDIAVFIELAWTPAMMDQCEDRLHRIGQKNPVNIYYLIAENSIEEYIYNIVIEKKQMFEKSTNIMELFKWIKNKTK